jgi:hypothetical protein
VLLVACGTLVGLVAISLAEFYRPALVDWITRDPEQIDSRLRLAFAVLAVAFVVPLLGFAAYFWRLGDRIVRAERFPPPGLAVTKDTVVLRGKFARRRGRLAQLLAAIFVLAASAFAIVLWWLMSLLRVRVA